VRPSSPGGLGAVFERGRRAFQHRRLRDFRSPRRRRGRAYARRRLARQLSIRRQALAPHDCTSCLGDDVLQPGGQKGCSYAHRGKWRTFHQLPNFVMRNPMDCRAGYCAMVPGHGQMDTSMAVALGPVYASAEGPRHRGRTAQSLCRPSRLGRCASQRPPGERQKGEAKAGDYNAPQRCGRRIRVGPFGAIQRIFVRGHLPLGLALVPMIGRRLCAGQIGIDAVRHGTDVMPHEVVGAPRQTTYTIIKAYSTMACP
jgi:hypothetical protein